MWFWVGRSDIVITINRGLLRCVFQCPKCTFGFHNRQTDSQYRAAQLQPAHLQEPGAGIQMSASGSQPYTCSQPALGGSLHGVQFCHFMPMQCQCHLEAGPELQFQCCNKWMRELCRLVKEFNYLKPQSDDPISLPKVCIRAWEHGSALPGIILQVYFQAWLSLFSWWNTRIETLLTQKPYQLFPAIQMWKWLEE